MAVSRSLTEWKVPRRFAWRVMIPKKIHHVQPAAAGRGEVQLDSEVPGQPGLDVGVLVGGVVVADHVQGDPGVGAGDSLEERQEARIPLNYPHDFNEGTGPLGGSVCPHFR